MANMTTLALTDEEYNKIIWTLEHGYTTALPDGKYIIHRPNFRVAFALKLEYATGMRVSDIVKLRLCDIVKDGDRYRLDIHEQKTGKKRSFRINDRIYACIEQYCADNEIAPDEPIIGTTTYAIQKQLKYVREYLGIDRCSTHSFRKSASMRIYNATGKDIVATQMFLNHSSPSITSRYLSTCSAILDDALDVMAM